MKHDAPPDWIGYQMGPTRDYHNEIRAERDALRAEVERLTRERKMTLIQFEETVARLADDKAHFKARAETAERKLAMAVEAFNSGIGEIETIGNALHNDGFVYANNAWRVVALFRATLAALEKNDG